MQELAGFTLHDWSCLRPELVWIYDREVAPESRSLHVHREATDYAWFLRRGECLVTAESGKFRLTPGMWLFVPQGKARQSFSEDAAILSVRFRYRWPSGEKLVQNPSGRMFRGSEFPDLERRAARLERLVRRNLEADTSYKLQSQQRIPGPLFLQFQSLFLSWLQLWFEISLQQGLSITHLRGQDSRMLRAARCLNDSPLDRHYPRSALTRDSGLSEVHLNRLFLNAFGLTPRKYWDRRRLEFARDCLETSEMPVKEIAYRLGFRSDAHFAVWFRRHADATPTEFRMTAQQS